METVGRDIKGLLERSDSYELSRFFEKTESEGIWYVWETIFERNGKKGKVYFAFLKIRGRYALADIDGHLAFMWSVK